MRISGKQGGHCVAICAAWGDIANCVVTTLMQRWCDMPILTLKLSANTQLKSANALAQALTALSTQVLHKRADVTSVVFQRLAAGDWWVGGANTEQVLVQLDIRITQDTNSEAEKAAFISQAFVLLSEHMANGQRMHPTSYISVQALPATDWGYGGLTQQQRREAKLGL
jgi:4-oxalocrotonate tautomerase